MAKVGPGDLDQSTSAIFELPVEIIHHVKSISRANGFTVYNRTAVNLTHEENSKRIKSRSALDCIAFGPIHDILVKKMLGCRQSTWDYFYLGILLRLYCTAVHVGVKRYELPLGPLIAPTRWPYNHLSVGRSSRNGE